MADRATYNAYNGVTGQFIDRFQGVFNDGLGCNLQPSLVDYAENAEDQWRGAVKKRQGCTKHLTKGYPIWAFSNVFEGYYLQGDNDVWYRTDLLLDYRRVPGSGGGSSYEDPLPDEDETYEGYDSSSDSTNTDTFTGSPPTGTGAYYSGVDEWRYRHIAQSINARRNKFGLASAPEAEVPTNVKDASITYLHINFARAYLEALVPSFCETIDTNPVVAWADYHDLLSTRSLGGDLVGVREWTNYTSTSAVAYRARMIPTDLIKDRVFFEMEVALRNMTNPAWALNYNGAYFQPSCLAFLSAVPDTSVQLKILVRDWTGIVKPAPFDQFSWAIGEAIYDGGGNLVPNLDSNGNTWTGWDNVLYVANGLLNLNNTYTVQSRGKPLRGKGVWSGFYPFESFKLDVYSIETFAVDAKLGRKSY